MTIRRDFIKNSALALSGLPLFQHVQNFNLSQKNNFNIEIYATNWGFKGDIESFCQKAKEYGYDGIEVWTPSNDVDRNELLQAIEQNELKLGLLSGNWGDTFDEHLDSYRNSMLSAISMEPEFINCHSGKDFYNRKQNSQFLEFSFDISSSFDIPVYHETHRGRMLFSAPVTEEYIDRYEQLSVTLDISHWCCVHESLLADQKSAVNKALARTSHIHSRVGFQEAPQIPNVDDAQYDEAIKAHFSWWDQVVKIKASRQEKLTMTTEFGPPPYMWTHPYDATPLSDVWEVNAAMKDLWVDRYLNKH